MVSSATWNGYESNSMVGNNNSNNSSSSDTKVVVRAKNHPDPVQGVATTAPETATMDTTKEDSSSPVYSTNSSTAAESQQQQQQQQHHELQHEQQQQENPAMQHEQQQQEDPAEVAAHKKEQKRQYNSEGHLEDSDGAFVVGDDADDEEASHSGVASLVSLTHKEQVVELFQHLRYNCGMIVNAKRVQLFIVLLIAINAAMLGIGTFDFVTENLKVDNAFEVIDQLFLIIFTIELAMQALYHGWRLLLDGWLVFDLVIIVTSWSFAQVQIIRAFRIFRALRLITRVKVMKNLVLGK
jgi:hypothetical protein